MNIYLNPISYCLLTSDLWTIFIIELKIIQIIASVEKSIANAMGNYQPIVLFPSKYKYTKKITINYCQ